MVLFVCFEAREGIGILGQGTMRWEQSPPSRSRCIPSAQAKPVGFSYFAKFQKLSLLLALYLSFLFYWFILTETKGVHLLGGGGRGEGEKKRKKMYQRKHTGKKRQSVGQPGCRSLSILVKCCKSESKNSSKRETCKFLSCIFKFASCVVSLL